MFILDQMEAKEQREKQTDVTTVKKHCDFKKFLSQCSSAPSL